MYGTGYYATGYHATGYYSRVTTLPETLLGYSWYSLIFEARAQLQDGVEGCYRYPDSMLLNILNRSLHELSRMRPEAFYEGFLDNNLNVPEITEANWDESVTIDFMFVPPVILYIQAMAETTEDDYVTDGLAMGHLTMFKTYVMGL